MCANLVNLSCSLETRFISNTETTPRPESNGTTNPPKIRRSLLTAFTFADLATTTSSSSSSSKDDEKEALSRSKRARTMGGAKAEEEVLSEEDVAKQKILQQFGDLLKNSPPMIQKEIEFRKLQRVKPTIFAKFNTHANLVMDGRDQGRFHEHGYLASEHSLVTKAPFYHANHVAKDIAAEAPNLATAEIFWRMVLQNKMDGVVMLTQFGTDQGFDYCAGSFGKFRVCCIENNPLYSEEGIPLIIKRTLEVQQQVEEQVVKKEIHHIQVLNWLDDEALPILTFKVLLDITRHYGKLVAHCIAGLGRTGTFLAARMVYPIMNTEKLEIAIPTCANIVREARPGSIRSLEQFRSIYDVMNAIKSDPVKKPEEEKER